MANCDVSTIKSQNRILTWKIEDWKLSGQTTISDIPLSELCQTNIVSNLLIWPRPIDLEKLGSYCSLVDGIPPLVYKSSQKKEVYNRFKEIFISVNKTFPSGFLDKSRREGITCFDSKTSSDLAFWTGMKLNYTEAKWYSPFKPLANFSKFKHEHKAWGDSHCAYFKGNSFLDGSCQKNFPCGICEVQHDKFVYLKGLCQYGYDLFDMKYYIYGLKNNRPYFK